MPHFSKSRLKLKANLSVDKEYRATGYVNIRTAWNDELRKFEQMTEAQKATCENLYKQLLDAGAEIGVTLSERTEAIDVREFPKVAYIPLFTNKPYDADRQVTSGYQAPPQDYQQKALDSRPDPSNKDLEDEIGW